MDVYRDWFRRSLRALLLGALLALIVVLTAGPVAPVSAAFPGANGRIATTLRIAGNSDIWTMDEFGGDYIRLTSHPDHDGDPVWSPDGNRLAFVSDRDGNSEIYVMNADGSDPHNVTNNAAWDALPSWSPSGTQIAFTSDRAGSQAIYTVDLANANSVTPRTSGASDSWPDWSPDGNRIAFSRTDSDGNTDIMVLTLSTNNLDNLTFWHGDKITQTMPNWSPDGSRIVFISSAGGRFQLYTMSPIVGNTPTPLAHAATGFDLFPAYSPDGQWVTFLRPSEDFGQTHYELWKAGVLGGPAIRLTHSFGAYGAAFNADWQPRPANSITVQANATELSPRDWTLQGSGPSGIGNFTIAARGGTRTFTNLTPGVYTITQTPNPGYFPQDPCVVTLAAGEAPVCQFFNVHDSASSVGKLAFTSRVEGGPAATYAIFADGIGRYQMTWGGGDDYEPTWSPDGSRIAFVRYDAAGNTALWTVNTSFLNASLLLAPPAGTTISGPSWTSHSNMNQLAFSSDRDGVDKLYMVNPLDGTGERTIADAQDSSYAPAISPNGQHVAYTRYVNGRSDIYLAPSGSVGTSVPLTNDAGYDFDPAWSPDGSRVVYSSFETGQPSELWIVDLNQNKRRLTTTPEGEYTPAWSPDGTTIAYTRYVNGEPDIYMINADGSGGPRQITNNPGYDFSPEWQPNIVGALTIKVVVNGPTPAADWQFDGGLGAFSLPAAGGGRTFHNRAPGSFTITQVAQAGYTAAFSCDNGATGAAGVTLGLLRGHHVTCTVTNTAQGTGLTVVKNLVGTAPSSPWQFSLSTQPAFTIPAVGGSKSFHNLSAGTYTVAETTRPGYAAAVSCLPGGETGGASVTVTLAPGQHKTCTFTNTNQMGAIKVVQEVKPNSAAGPGPWEFSGGLGTFTLPRDGGQKTFDVVAGSYTIEQKKVDGFTQRVRCGNNQNGMRQVTVALAAGQTITCTFTATKENPAPGAVVYSSNADGDADIYLLDPATRDGQPIQLTNAPGDDTEPVLSPDGTTIAFTSEREGVPALYVMDFDGAYPERVLPPTAARARNPVWSPDGLELAYETNQDGNDEIYTVPLLTRAPVRVTNSPAAERDPAWLPGAPGMQRRLVYVSDRDGNPELYEQVLSVGVAPRRLTRNTTVDYAPVAARRSSGAVVVAYSCNHNGGLSHYFVCAQYVSDTRAATADPIVLVDVPGVNYPLGWSADGEQLTFSSTRDGDADLYRVDADGENETQLTNDPASEGEADPWPLPLGNVTIRAVVIGPAPATDWVFGGDLGTFHLPAAGGQTTFNGQVAGGYWLTETPTPGYSRTVQCDNGATGAGSVILTVEPGRNVTCTFTHVADAGAMYRLFLPIGIR